MSGVLIYIRDIVDQTPSTYGNLWKTILSAIDYEDNEEPNEEEDTVNDNSDE